MRTLSTKVAVVVAAVVSVALALAWAQRSPISSGATASPSADAKAWSGRVLDSSGRGLPDASVEAVWIGADEAPGRADALVARQPFADDAQEGNP